MPPRSRMRQNERSNYRCRAAGSLNLNALEFAQHWSIPHFYFHVVTAYDILRHVGVPLGKRDFMSGITQGYVRQTAQA